MKRPMLSPFVPYRQPDYDKALTIELTTGINTNRMGINELHERLETVEATLERTLQSVSKILDLIRVPLEIPEQETDEADQ